VAAQQHQVAGQGLILGHSFEPSALMPGLAAFATLGDLRHRAVSVGMDPHLGRLIRRNRHAGRTDHHTGAKAHPQLHSVLAHRRKTPFGLKEIKSVLQSILICNSNLLILIPAIGESAGVLRCIADGKTPLFDTLSKSHANLLRLWADV